MYILKLLRLGTSVLKTLVPCSESRLCHALRMAACLCGQSALSVGCDESFVTMSHFVVAKAMLLQNGGIQAAHVAYMPMLQ